MRERESPRVQRHAAEADRAVLAARVLALADQGMADRREMETNLVVAAGLELHLDDRRATEAFEHLVVRDRRRGVRTATRAARTSPSASAASADARVLAEVGDRLG